MIPRSGMPRWLLCVDAVRGTDATHFAWRWWGVTEETRWCRGSVAAAALCGYAPPPRLRTPQPRQLGGDRGIGATYALVLPRWWWCCRGLRLRGSTVALPGAPPPLQRDGARGSAAAADYGYETRSRLLTEFFPSIRTKNELT